MTRFTLQIYSSSSSSSYGIKLFSTHNAETLHAAAISPSSEVIVRVVEKMQTPAAQRFSGILRSSNVLFDYATALYIGRSHSIWHQMGYANPLEGKKLHEQRYYQL